MKVSFFNKFLVFDIFCDIITCKEIQKGKIREKRENEKKIFFLVDSICFCVSKVF
jgi:hypothetical protein